MSCRIDQYSVLIESSSTQREKDVCQHGRSRTNLSREGKCIKFQFSVYLIYQRLARKAVEDDEESSAVDGTVDSAESASVSRVSDSEAGLEGAEGTD